MPVYISLSSYYYIERNLNKSEKNPPLLHIFNFIVLLKIVRNKLQESMNKTVCLFYLLF